MKAQEEAHWCGSEGPVLSKATYLHPPERPEELSQAPTLGSELRDVPVLDLGLPSAPLLNSSRRLAGGGVRGVMQCLPKV